MSEKPPEREILDAEFRVVGEGRWEPFKRWFWGHFDGWFPADWATYTPREKRAHFIATAVTTMLAGLMLWAFLAFVVWLNARRY